MKKKRTFLLIFSMILSCTGCASKADNTLQSVEEIQTTEEITFVKTNNQEETYDGETLNGVPVDMVKCYISDDFFVEDSETDFELQDGVIIGNKDVNKDDLKYSYHIKILGTKVSDNLADFGDYFVQMESNIQEFVEFSERLGYTKDNLTFASVSVEVTNLCDKEEAFYIGNMNLQKRIADDRLVKYGLEDKYVIPLEVCTELWHDYEERVQRTNDYYKVNMQAGETISTNLLFLIDKNDLSEDLYLQLFHINGEYSTKYKCDMPTVDPGVRYIKVRF